MGFQTLRIDVGASGIDVESPDGSEIREPTKPNELDIEILRVMEDAVVRGAFGDARSLKAFGSLLYRTLFIGNVHVAFREARSNQKSGDSLHIRLVFQDEIGKKLAGLSWEYLHYPESSYERGYFFLWENMTVSRLLPMFKPKMENLKFGETVTNIWLIVSAPEKYNPVLWQKTVEHVETLKERINKLQPDRVKISVFKSPTLVSLTPGVAEPSTLDPPHIVHFIGHGQFSDPHGGMVGLTKVNDEQDIEWCDDSTFVELIKPIAASTRLIFLQQCEGGKSNFMNGFSGVAVKLGREITPAVLAMQHPITNQDAIDFAENFYRNLFESGDVVTAIQAGRTRLQELSRERKDRRSFGTPVLHLYSREAQIFEPISVESPRVPVQQGPRGAARPVEAGVPAYGNGSAAVETLLTEFLQFHRDRLQQQGEPARVPVSAVAGSPSDTSLGSGNLSSVDPKMTDPLLGLSSRSVELGLKTLLAGRGNQE